MHGRRFSPRIFSWASFGAALTLGLVYLWDPAGSPILCLFRRVVSLPCPGCGLSRAVSRLLHGEVGSSIRLHPFALLLGLEAVTAWVVVGVRVHRGFPIALPRSAGQWALGHAVGLIAFWLGRLASGTAPF